MRRELSADALVAHTRKQCREAPREGGARSQAGGFGPPPLYTARNPSPVALEGQGSESRRILFENWDFAGWRGAIRPIAVLIGVLRAAVGSIQIYIAF